MRGEENLVRLSLCVPFLLLTICAATEGRVIYVDADATGANDGSSWENAYKYLRVALGAAKSGDEIHVAQGIYTPAIDVRFRDGDRQAKFSLKSGVAIRGGFAGLGEPDPNSRDIERYKTILSGDLNGDDIDVNDPYDLFNDPTRSENSYHVVYSVGADSNVILDGFVITSATKGGMANYGGNLRISNCTFMRNTGTLQGGAIFNCEGGLTLTKCKFISNLAREGGAIYSERFSQSSVTLIEDCSFINNGAIGNAGYGGGLMHCGGSLELTNCKFSKNSAGEVGGAVFIDCLNANETTVITNCLFNANSTVYFGGAICDLNRGTVTNCIFTGNRAEKGGAIYYFNYFRDYSMPLTNCTFSNNWADFGDSIYCDGSVNLNNCILWGSGGQIYVDAPYEAPAFVRYSDVQGGWEGEGNIDEDPLFADAGHWININDPNQTAEPNDPNAVWIDGDYHLKSQAGRWDPSSQTWVVDDVTSPCIDAGDSNSPIGFEPFPNGGVVNMGAYGGTVEASKSYFGEPVCETIIAGDINGDCKVDFADLYIMIYHWMEDDEPETPPEPTPGRR